MIYPVISIKQPWAWLILQSHFPHARKDYENRNWPLPEKFTGRTVLIHASASPAAKASVIGEQLRIRDFNCTPPVGFSRQGIALTGHIVGAAVFSGCIPATGAPPSAWCEPDAKWWWKIEKAVPVQPVPAKGWMQFWKFNYPHRVNA
ncbi:hypothetical protein [Oleidesulfovibrio alaskensis]|uniref:hypothetical protein n=1 Tax=Oleidesulfovibrio alaskensis TaxID=58180 RepID=UPI000427A41F|nr:hypothetical protein [Oleidesulfovibrio alaskensis]